MVKIDGLDGMRRSLKKYAEDFPDVVKKTIAIEGLRLQALAKKDVVVDTGKLRQSILLEIEDEGFTAKVSANAPYAPYIEFGTGGQVDIPKGWEEIASNFRGKGVRKINLPPRPFLIPNFIKVRRNLTEKFRREIRKIEK